MYISLNRPHPFWSYRETLLYITYPLHAHYMTHLFHLHWPNYINTMNRSNNETHYILLSKLYSFDILYNEYTTVCKLYSVSEIINWSSANNSVLKINSLKYLLVFSSFNHFLMTSSIYKLNKTRDSGQPCLIPWVITLES